MPKLTPEQGAELKAAMIAMGITTRALARQSGYSQAQVSGSISCQCTISRTCYNAFRKALKLELLPVTPRKPKAGSSDTPRARVKSRTEVVDSIMNLLNNGDEWDLLRHLKPRQPKTDPAMPEQRKPGPKPKPKVPKHPRKMGRKSKIDDVVFDFINQNNDKIPQQVCEMVHEKFGLKICISSVYKVWKKGQLQRKLA